MAPDRRRLSRRQFGILGTQLSGAIVGLALGIPIVGFLLSPLFRRQPYVERMVGDIANVPEGEPTKFEVAFPQNAWPVPEVKAAVYVVKVNGKTKVLSNVCSHMECPVRWETELRQFLCPCHGGLYDITGQNVGGPPPKPLPEYVHRLDGTTLYIENRFTEDI
ncbi:MAG: menaquinol-cytochrome c reductase iron-sulfur subunit [Candidatus Dormibacteria bacterium]